MPLDTFICGQCEENFNDIQVFITHKKDCILPVQNSESTVLVAEASATPVTEEDAGATTAVQIDEALQYTAVDGAVNLNVTDSTDLLSQVAQAALVTGDDAENTKAVVIITSPETGDTTTAAAVQPLLEALESVSVDQLQVKEGLENAEPIDTSGAVILPAITTAPSTTTTTPVASTPTTSATTTTAVSTTTPTPTSTATPVTSTGRRRGRPRKGEEKNVQRDAVPKEPEKLPIPDKGKDGRYHCARCKRSFPKERYFITHKCLASSDYVDISKKDVVKIEDESEEEAEEMPTVGDQEEYEAHTSEEDDIGMGNLTAAAISAGITDSNDMADVEGQCSVQMSANLDFDGTGERSKNPIQDIPVFNTKEEKMAFERSLNVDLSGVDHMFRVHVIEQDLNEYAPSAPRTGTFGLSLYSCNTCDKVFKTLSHMRLHCLIHTNLKPFKCSKCSYASNSKGNLYTHMRKHTGQFYICSKCPFKTVNKSHLLEHEATHSKVRHPCEMCKKDYNTVKSLVNHVRKYHSSSKKGKEYLAKFLQGRQDRGTTVIHQCHVCNRKFKKKIDCDRHLFVHDIKDIPSVQHCELCDYSASRRIYLEKHFLKHRVIYCCILCQDKFLSTVRLVEHINTIHSEESGDKNGDSIFEQCIASSLYLPEPDDTLPDQDKEFDNLPPELSAVAMNNNNNNNHKENGEAEPMDTSVPTSCTEANESKSSESTTTMTTSDAVNESEVPMEVEAEPVSKISDPVEDGEKAKDGKSQEGNATSESKPESEDIDSESRIVKEETQEKENKSGDIKNESETVNEIDTATENLMADQENSTDKTNKDSPSSNTVKVGEERLKLQNNSSETGEAENGEDLPEEDEDAGKSSKASDIIKRLGYRPLTLEILQKMRQTFGTEECEYCGRLFYNRADYEPHVRTHTGDKPFQCEVCDYRAITRDSLKRHIEREHDKVTFPCKECEFVANSRTKLWNHQLKHRGISGLECPECHEKFENLMKLRNHILLKHPLMSKEEVQRVTGLGHRIQRKMGRRSYKCPYCDRMFIRANSELRKHIWIHEGIKPFRCPVCPHACRSKNNLQAHMLRHSNEKPFMCNDCGKAYKSKTALRWHVRSHKDGKLFKCDKCSYEATQRSHLKRHMETHDIVKRYVCQHCDYSANTLGYMKLHYTRNHKGMQYTCNTPTEKTTATTTSDSRVYRCLSCDYLFGNLSDLKRHLRIRHHVQVQDIQTLENTTASELVFQVSEDPPVYTEEANTVPQELDEKTASAVNILQHIIDMSQQGAFGQQQITVQSDSGQMVTVNPETIIVQEEGQEVLVADGNQDLTGNQYVIQYVTAQDGVQITSGETPLEVHTADIQNITTTATELHQEIVQS